MSIIKNALLFAGWVPSLLGGATGVWLMTADKTVEDALKKTGLPFLNSNSDFESVYYELEDDDNLFKDIKDVEKFKGKAISEWCKDTLQLPLNSENIKETISKATKYCMGNKRKISNAKDFENFENIVNLVGSSKVKTSEMGGLVMAHLGSNESEDVYYTLDNNEDEISKDAWRTINTKRNNALMMKLYVDDKYTILKYERTRYAWPGSKEAQENKLIEEKWNSKINLYNLASEDIKFPGLKDPVVSIYRKDPRGGNGITRTNLLQDQCIKLLKERYVTGESYDKAKALFIRWCTEENSK